MKTATYEELVSAVYKWLKIAVEVPLIESRLYYNEKISFRGISFIDKIHQSPCHLPRPS